MKLLTALDSLSVAELLPSVLICHYMNHGAFGRRRRFFAGAVSKAPRRPFQGFLSETHRSVFQVMNERSESPTANSRL